MVNLVATATIVGVDRASATFAKVAASARVMANSMAATNARLATVGRGLGSGFALGGAGLGALVLAGQYQVSKLANQVRIFGDVSEKEYARVHAAAKNAAGKYGIPLREMLEGTRELLQGGIPESSIATSLDILGAAAARNHEPVGRMAEMLVRTARVMGMTMDTADQTAEALTRAADMLGTAPLISTESTAGFFEALKFIAPIGRVIGMSEPEMAAWNATMADLGFLGEESGAGLRTIIARLVGMSPKAKAALRGEGIDTGELFSMRDERLYDMAALRERLAGANLFLDDGTSLDRFGSPARFRGVQDWRDHMLRFLTEALGIGKGDVENRKALTAVIEQHIASSIEKLNLKKVMEVLGKANSSLYTDAELAGKQRLQILEALKHANQLYEKKLAEYERRHKGATRRGVKQLLGTLAFEMNRVGSNWSNVVDSLFLSGGQGGLAQFFKALADGLGDLSRANPDTLGRLALGLGALATAPVAGYVIGTMAASVRQLAGALAALGGAFLRAPILGKLLMGGGLLALGDVDEAFQRRKNALGEPVAGSSPVEETLGSLAGLAGEISGAIGDAYSGLRSMFGFDGRGSLLVDSLQLINFLAEGAATSLRYWRDNAPAILGGRPQDVKPPGAEGSWWRGAQDVWEGELMNGLRAPVEVQGTVGGRMEVDLRIHAPEGFRAYLESKSGGELTGTLNNGKSMPDSAVPRR